ncbi:MAG: hypothetical protein CMD02_03320 [Flavobacteriales bacterium]|nr:hypothetical protein [Flavobacteriales bacterium]|tara:strand:- start:1549 stop:3858 length:2310 start_codon:yes stop_codon:yes gene_type:complete
MKKILTLILIGYSFISFSQTFKVIDENGKKIGGVLFYSNNKNMTSNKSGRVDLSKFQNVEWIDVYHISYKRERIKKENITNNLIVLQSNNIELEEVSIHSSLNVEENKTQVIKMNQLEIQGSLSKNPAEILEKSGGLIIQKSQNGGGSPNIRGFEANRILLVVDGVKLNNTIYRSGHLQNILSVDPYVLESVSVLHGPSSVFYGSGALGGAIILNTINIEKLEENKSSFTQQFESSSSSITTNFHSKYRINKNSFLSSISFKKYGNLHMGKNRLHGYENWGVEEYATDRNEQLYGEYYQYDAIQKMYFPINSKSSISLNSQFSTTSNINRFDKLNDVSNGNPKYKFWYYGPQERILQSILYNRDDKSLFYDNIKLKISYQAVKESRNTQKFTEEFLRNRSEIINIYESKLDFDKQIDKLLLRFGISNRYENLRSTSFKENNLGDVEFSTTRYPDNGGSDNNFASYIHTELKLHKRLKWFNAVRYDYNEINMNFSENNPFNIEGILKNNNENYSASTNFFINANENNFISFSLFNSFRNPNIDDLGKVFSKTDGIVTVPNLNLKSEKILSSEFIWKFINDKTSFDLVLFYSDLKDAIEKRPFKFNGQDSIIYDGEMMRCIANTNINSAKMKGINFRFKINIIKSLLFSGNASYVSSITSDSIPMAHIPPFSSRGEIIHNINKKSKIKIYSNFNGWKYASNFDQNGIDNLDEATIDGTPSWWTLNLIYSKKINNLKISFACENILDAHYKTFASGISASGRNFILNLQADF